MAKLKLEKQKVVILDLNEVNASKETKEKFDAIINLPKESTKEIIEEVITNAKEAVQNDVQLNPQEKNQLSLQLEDYLNYVVDHIKDYKIGGLQNFSHAISVEMLKRPMNDFQEINRAIDYISESGKLNQILYCKALSEMNGYFERNSSKEKLEENYKKTGFRYFEDYISKKNIDKSTAYKNIRAWDHFLSKSQVANRHLEQNLKMENIYNAVPFLRDIEKKDSNKTFTYIEELFEAANQMTIEGFKLLLEKKMKSEGFTKKPQKTDPLKIQEKIFTDVMNKIEKLKNNHILLEKIMTKCKHLIELK